MNWIGIRKLNGMDLIHSLEHQYAVTFPDDYKVLVQNSNAGIPDKQLFTVASKTYYLERLISANTADSPNICTAMGWVDQESAGVMVPIALTLDHDMICLNFDGAGSKVVLIEYETEAMHALANDVSELLSKLHD